ncbi:hypothetical protein BH11BAC7_BH11BAC7_33260 [soil metagenome]
MAPILLRRLFILVCILSLEVPGYTQTLDPTFGTGGFAPFFTARSYVRGMTVQVDEKILTTVEVPNYSSPTDWLTEVARFNTDGSVDSSYGNAGVAQVNSFTGDHSYSYDIDLQSNGKCISGGSSIYCSAQMCGVDNLMVFRLTQSGQLDSTFGYSGFVMVGDLLPSTIAMSHIYRIKVMPDDKIIVYGNCLLGPTYGWASNIFIARLNADGTPDLSFGSNGNASMLFSFVNFLDAPDFTLDATHNIYLTGTMTHYNDTNVRGFVLKLDNNGIIDNSFGINGLVELYWGYQVQPLAIGLRSDNKVIVSGYFMRNYYTNPSSDTAFVTVFEPNGALSAGNPGGYRAIDFGTISAQIRDIDMLSDDRFVFTGVRKDNNSVGDSFIGRLNSDGTPDTSFSGDGRSFVPYIYQLGVTLNRVMVLPNCQVLAGGGVATSNGIFSLLIRVNASGCPVLLSTESPVSEYSLSVFPNPNDGRFNLLIEEDIEDFSTIALDLQGRIVYQSSEKNVHAGIKELNLDCEAGVYMFKISIDGNEFTQQVIVTSSYGH